MGIHIHRDLPQYGRSEYGNPVEITRISKFGPLSNEMRYVVANIAQRAGGWTRHLLSFEGYERQVRKPLSSDKWDAVLYIYCEAQVGCRKSDNSVPETCRA